MLKVALITAGGSGMGADSARALAKDGYKIGILSSSGKAEILAKELGGIGVTGTNKSEVDLQKLVNASLKKWGRIDVLVNSAGVAGANAVVEEYPIEEWNKIMSVNLNGTFHTNRAVIAGMKQRGYGRIVNIASIAGKEGNPNASAYSASKAGVIALTKSLGKEAADFNIGVNCVTPAAARTAIFDQMSEEHINYMLSKIPRNRFVDVAEVANMICWIASAENAFTTGAVFDLSGGRATY